VTKNVMVQPGTGRHQEEVE